MRGMLQIWQMGKYVKSYTEITGASNLNRFIPRLDNVHIISWPYHWLNDTICRYGSKGDQIDLNYFKEINAYPPPKHLFTSMIRQPKPHREMLWDLLKSRDMVNEFCSYAPEGVHIDLKEQKSEGQIFFHNDDEDIQARTHMPPTWYKEYDVPQFERMISNPDGAVIREKESEYQRNLDNLTGEIPIITKEK